MQKKVKEIVDSLLGDNRTFYWQVALLRIMILDDNLKYYIEIINWKWEDNDFAMNSME